MEAIVNWVQAMTDEGHIATEIRVAEPWRQALADAGVDLALLGPVRPGNESLIEYTTATDTFFAVVSH
jgi:hypothetical protein